MTVYIPEDPTRMMRAKRSRYGNKKGNYMGMTFDSVGERDRFIYLQDAEQRGQIRNLRRQVTFDLGTCKYRADFQYEAFRTPTPWEPRQWYTVIEDFKGGYKLPNDFRIKAKMMEERGTPIRIVKLSTAAIG